MTEPRRTPLYDLHRELGARIVDFAGWAMPVQYPTGIIAEHRQCRTAAALFDVSHMGQLRIDGTDPAGALEWLVPADLRSLALDRARYTVLTLEDGGIIDDLIVSQAGDHLFVVVNAGGREGDLAHLQRHLPADAKVTPLFDRALLALQGPAAVTVLSRICPNCEFLPFMGTAELPVDGIPARVSRLGYTGEDGFEVSVPAEAAVDLARRLLAAPEVLPAGLGARDSLRLEAGLCLYGHDIDRTTTPIEAGIAWSIGRRRRAEGGFPGAGIILDQLAGGAPRQLVGLRPTGRAPAREGTEIQDTSGRPIGTVTSGGFGPTVDGPVAMGYVAAAAAEPDTEVQLLVRGKPLPARIVSLPFVPHRYHR
ncbi:MAG: glycine cleavage system aminomethyltransferase GcvT [Geminicoccaceae bacterium]